MAAPELPGARPIAAPEAAGKSEVGGDGDCVRVVVQNVGGEAALPPSSVPAEFTVGDLLQRIRSAGGPPCVLSLLLGDRELLAWEHLGNLKVRDPEEGLALTLVRHMDREVVERLAQRIRGKELLLSRHVSEMEMAAVACLLLDPRCAIEKLSLARTNVVDITMLAQALRVNESLKDLELSHTRIADVAELAEALQVNETLETLSLAGTAVSDISSLAEALLVNKCLHFLDLERARVSEVGGLARALRVNRALRMLDLSRCPIPYHAREELYAAKSAKLDTEDVALLYHF